MANKKLQNNQNRKNTDGPTMNGNNSTMMNTSIQTSQNSQNTNAATSNATQNNNNSASSNAPSTPTPSNAATTNPTNISSAQQQSQSHNSQSHQRLSSTSSSSQQQSNISKQPLKKTQHHEVEKIYLQINNSGGSQSNQSGSGFRNSGNKDQRAREKEKEKNFQGSGRQSNQSNHHHSNHTTGSSGGGNQQNRKKDNKNRDHSNQSHRGGGFTNSYGNHHQQQQSSYGLENAKSSGFLSNSSLSSAGHTSSPAPASSTPTASPIAHESKTVQTDPQLLEIKKKKEKPKTVKKEEEPSSFKSTDPRDMDTVMAFKEHDEWNKVELMCELLSFLTPTDLRLLGNCIEGSVRSYTNQMRPVEKTSNCADPTACLPQYVCSPPPPPQISFPTGVPETALYNRKSAVNNVFGPQPPPGLPSLIGGMPNLVCSIDTNYNHPSSSTTPSSSISAAAKEICNGTTTTSGTTGGNNTPSDTQQQQDSQQQATRGTGSIVNGNQSSSTTTPEPEAVPNPGSLHSNSSVPPARSSSIAPQSTPPVPQEPEKFLKAVRDITSYVYVLMSVCASTNRKSAAKISDYVKNVILREKAQILERIPDELDRIDVLQDIGKIVAAMTHHPAVTLDDKMKYADMRDGLRAEIENLFRQYYSTQKEAERKKQIVPSMEGVGDVDDYDDSDDEEEDDEDLERRFGASESYSRFFGIHPQSSSSGPPNFFITRFIGRQIERNDNLFSLEIHWSDGDRTFAQRTRDQLRALQHRLLDEFGQQRSEKYHHHHGMSSSFSSFDEENKKLSTSTSTMETAFAPSGERIVPRLARDATPVQYVQYINELSDLPARMMLSSVICEEFNGTRSRTEDEARDSSDGLIFSRWKNPRAKSPVRYFKRNAAGNIDPIELPINMQPFLYSTVPHSQMQTLFPSCSNCGGGHNPKHCEKPTLLDKKASLEHKMRLDPDGSQPIMSSQLGGGTSSSNSYVPVHPQMPQTMYLESAQPMMGNNHFAHHQHQQMLQNNMFHNGQFRTNAQFDPPMSLIYYHQPTVQNVNNSSGNNGSGGTGANQNSNF